MATKLEQEIMKFYEDIASYLDASKNIQPPININFDPFLFLLWRLNKNDNE